MSTPLSHIPSSKRRQLAATLGLFAMLFVAVGAVAATGADTAVVKAFVVIALLVAVLLGLIAWGVANSIRTDRAVAVDSHLDAAIEAAVAAQGGPVCGCGHDHDPSVTHVPDDPCARDGHGDGCTHSCETCILSTLRRTSERSAVAARPSPGPKRPSPTPR